MAVELDLAKPIVNTIIINGKAQKIEHEGIPILCYPCGKVGHLKEKCPVKMEEIAQKKDNTNPDSNGTAAP